MAGVLRSAGLRALAAAALMAGPGAAQSPPFSSTLRYGSGYFDVPAAVVLPGAGFRAGLSAFRVQVDAEPTVDAAGNVVGAGEGRTRLHGDASLAVGILGRGELGATLQSFASKEEGGRLLGAFGKLLLLDPTDTGLGLAVGARYLGAPDFGDGVRRAPTRLGFPDSRALRRFTDGRTLDTRLTLYAVATLRLPGVRASWLPENDVNVSLGYGTGMFREGGDLSWYAPPGMDGWFLAGGVDLALGPGTLLVLKAEHSGFDVNAGAEVARGGVRVGIHLLGVNHDGAASAYRSRKVGLSVSLTACPLLNRACTPGLRTRAPADTVRLPAPPPDTVRIRDTAAVPDTGLAEPGSGASGTTPAPDTGVRRTGAEGRGAGSVGSGHAVRSGRGPGALPPPQCITFSRRRFRASRTAMAAPRSRSSFSHALAPISR